MGDRHAQASESPAYLALPAHAARPINGWDIRSDSGGPNGGCIHSQSLRVEVEVVAGRFVEPKPIEIISCFG